jgi:dihydroorotate dehydrogenase electron transfer subunit
MGPQTDPIGSDGGDRWAELLAARDILPGQSLQTWHAAAIASRVRAGQYVHLRTGDPSGLVMRRPYPINTADPASGTITIQVATADSAAGRAPPSAEAWLAGRRPGDRIELTGPLGRPFEVDPRAQHLLLVAEGSGVAGVRALADEAIRDGRQVTLLFAAASAREVYPSSLLPDELEYVVATADGSLGQVGSVVDLMPEYEAWADQAFASGPPALLRALAALAVTRRGRLGVASLGRKRGAGRPVPAGSTQARRKAFLQVALEQTMGCAAGTCLGCAVPSTAGSPLRACREGPVFGAAEIEWEALP